MLPPTAGTTAASSHGRASRSSDRRAASFGSGQRPGRELTREGVRMRYHQGRLIDHVHLRVRDVEASRRFYRAALDALGLAGAFGEGDGFFHADELYVD